MRSSQLSCRTLVSRMSQRVTSLQVLRIHVFFLKLLHELGASLNIGDMLVLYKVNGKENGNYYSILRLYLGNIGILSKLQPL